MDNRIRQSSWVLFVGSLMVNLGNYGFNLGIGRWLSPAQFAEANFLVSVLLGLSFLATALQLTAARYAIRPALPIRLGLAVGLLLGLGAVEMARFFQLSSPIPLWMLAVAIPVYFLLSYQRGRFQGCSHFGTLAVTYQVEVFVRLLVGLGLVALGWGVLGVGLGLVASLFVSFGVSCRLKQTAPVSQSQAGSIGPFLAWTMLYEFSQIVFTNSDVWLVKHYFPGHLAGQYAALALIGRVVYFGTWSVAMVLFPKVVARARQGLPTRPLFYGSFLLVGGLALGLVGCCACFPTRLVTVLLGDHYAAVGPYLWPYALLTALFALANLLVYYYLSLENFVPIGLSLAFGVVQVLLMGAFHEQIEQLLVSQLVATSLLLISLLGYHFTVQERLEVEQIPVGNVVHG
jgi:O-antigen/teichoic acid export membrane protein